MKFPDIKITTCFLRKAIFSISFLIAGNLFSQCTPPGLIVAWSGTISSIPSGWVICDGTNGTPDLRNKFIQGAPLNTNPGSTGGSLTHNHGGVTGTTTLTTGAAGTAVCGIAGNSCSWLASPASHTHTYTHSHTIAAASNLPPYYEVVFIMATPANTTIPNGIIVEWSGALSSIPAGWLLCDGTLSTIDLRDRFIKGAPAAINPGAVGGSASHTHVIGTDNTAFSPDYSPNFTGNCGLGCGSWGGNAPGQGHDHQYIHTHTLPTVSNLPPYYEVAYLMASAATSYPNGIIAEWSGIIATVPSGWFVCDGLNSTPNLSNSFLKGAPALVNPGTTGGSYTHTHGNTTSTDPGGVSTTNFATNGTAGGQSSMAVHNHTVPAHNHTIPNPIDSCVPPYYDVLFVMSSGFQGNLSISSITGNFIPCLGSTVSYSISPVAGAVSYTWSVPPGSGILSGQGTTSVSVTVGNSSGNICVFANGNCGNGAPFCTAISIAQAATLTSSFTDVLCNGGNSGSATITPSGGTSPYSYSWSDGQTVQTATGLVPGSYTCTVTTTNGCTSTQTVSITEPGILSATTSQSDVSCNSGNNGSATAVPAGGTSPYVYSWSSGGTSAIENNLPAGNYTVTVTDNNSCVTTQTVSITEPAALTTTASQANVLCNGGNTGTATVTPIGGIVPYTYSWSSGGASSTENNLSAGNYTVTITDNNSCTTTQTISITEPATLSATTTQSDVSCSGGNNGSATAIPAGGTSPYTYSWSSGGTSAMETNLSAGNYTITITDNNSCVTTQTVSISEPTVLTATTTQSDVSCSGGNNGSATAIPAGGTSPYTYSWSSGGTAATENNLSAGNYTVTITDNNSCVTTQTVTITEPSALTATTTQSDVSCSGGNNGSATAIPAGGTSPYTYSWSSGGTAATENNLSAGNYTVTITDNNSCVTTQTFTITEPAALTATVTQSDVSCGGGNNGSATAVPAGGTSPYTYSWSSGGTAATENNLSAGNYTVTITDNNSCVTTQTFTIIEPAALTTTTSQSNVLCNGGSTGTATVIPAGGTSPYVYSWSSAGTSATETNLVAGNYTVTVTDNNGCVTTQTVVITEPAAITTSASSVPAFCSSNTGSASVIALGGTVPYAYSWSSGGTAATESNLTAGNYTVTITDNNGCTATQTISVTSNNPTSLSLSSTQTGCASNNGTAAALLSGGTLPYTYNWSNGQTTQVVSNLGTGSYTVTVSDANGCAQTQTITVTQTAGPTATIMAGATTITLGGNTQLVASGGVTYLWSPSSGLSCDSCANPIADPSQTVTYCVEVIDTNGCSDNSCMTIQVDIPCGDVFVPNAFSPNNDGTNDLECVLSPCLTATDFHFAIYDRWGEKVFESNDPAVCWDGTYNGEKLNNAVFVYYLNATLINGEIINKKGNISIVK